MRHPRFLFIGAVAAVLCFTVPVMAQNIATSPHNLNLATSANVALPQGQICIACHTPHGAAQFPSVGEVGTTPGTFLWNHNTTPNKSYAMYGGASDSLLDGTSRLCLSCHDGAIAVDAYGGGAGTVNIGTLTDSNGVLGGAQIAGSANNDISNSHPVGVAYPGITGTTVVNGKTVYTGSGTGGAYSSTSMNNPNNFPSGTVRLSTLADNVTVGVGCGTCHNPHNDSNGSFLRVNNAGSALCLTCHIK
jgi:predicted CXXCH cytochrome family protein